MVLQDLETDHVERPVCMRISSRNPNPWCRFKGGEQRVVDKERQLANNAEHDYDR